MMKCLPRPHDGGCSGLTLVELLVSVSILAVVAGAVLSVLYSGILVWERAGGYDMKRMEAMLALENLEREARNSFLFYAVDFQGGATGVKFAGIEKKEDQAGVLRFCETEYAFDRAAHVFRRRSRIYPFVSSGGEEAVPVIVGVDDVRITYAEVSEEGEGTPVWVESWDDKKCLPAALRIELLFQGSDGPVKITRTMGLPVHSLKEKEAGNVVGNAA